MEISAKFPKGGNLHPQEKELSVRGKLGHSRNYCANQHLRHAAKEVIRNEVDPNLLEISVRP